MIPSDDLRGHLTAEARPYGHRREQVHYVDLPGDKRLYQLRPAAEHARRFGLQALGVEQATTVCDQERRSVGDRQIADAHRRVWLSSGARLQDVEQRQAA